ncbi:MerR family transcriptional regulator [Enterococcus sp. 5H]|uniref:MerR family transcriptional regulator n=1 Tax=Enterococcus sp. 5H TaxID=1229490 RepID=UPI002302F9FD|nr:MerR family transcriptional regulator [Enterococcus sp. 5H]MDA9471213.1 Transcriptional regulator, MerR family [Enterococcus sp. 5H]
MFKISEFSKLTTISSRMLRHYDKIGLLKPALTDQENNYRYYTPEQINQANHIRSLKNIGLSLTEIKTILTESIEESEYLTTQKKQLETELAEKKLQLSYLQLLEKKATASPDNLVNYPIETKQLPEILCISYRKKVDSYYHEEQLWQQLFSTIRKQDLAKLNQSIAIFHPCTGKIDIEVLIEIPKTLQSIYPAANYFLPGLVASVVVSGGYSSIPNVHKDLQNWLQLNNYVRSGNPFNIYHTSPATEERDTLYITEICYPIK